MIYPVYSANAIAMAAARGPLFERSAVDDREATTSGCEFASTLFLVPRQGLAICLPCLSGRAQAYSAGGVGPKDALCASLSSNESIAQTFLVRGGQFSSLFCPRAFSCRGIDVLIHKLLLRAFRHLRRMPLFGPARLSVVGTAW